METKILQVNDTKIKLFSFFDRANLIYDRKKFLNEIIGDIKKTSSAGFAGFLDERGFRYHFDFWNPNDKTNVKYSLNKISLDKCSKLVEEAFRKISDVLDKEEIHIYLFPTLSKFTIEKMNGNSGRWVWKDVIYIDIFPKEKWEEYFKSAIIHETAHTLSDYFSDEISIGEGMIFEGLAEHFQEKFTGIKNPWVKVFPEKQALKLFEELKPKLNEKSYEVYGDIFFGNKKYPLWAGYTIGYYLIKEYLKNKKNIDWKELLREDPNKILKGILNSYGTN